MDQNELNVIHLPSSTGGNAWGLSRGERQLGINSQVLYAVDDNWTNYPCDIEVPDSRFKILKPFRRIPVFVDLMKKYDVFHYNFGRSLFDWLGIIDLLELPVLNEKRICVTYNGSDARPYGAIKGQQRADGFRSDRKDRVQRKRIEKFQHYNASFFALNPDLLKYLPANTCFIPYTIANWDKIEIVRNKDMSRRPLRVVHAPTDRLIKGTDAVISAVENIQKRYPNDIELKLVEGLPFDQALKEYAYADVVIDQLKIGWYGAFAVEVIKMGKPVMVYINHEDLCYIPPPMAEECEKSLINVNEDNIEETLLYYMNNRGELYEKQQAQLEYVNKWHDPVFVAKMVAEKYV